MSTTSGQMDQETGMRIEEMHANGWSIRRIAETLRLNREKVRRYLAGEVRVKGDTELTQNRHKTDTSSEVDSIKSEVLSEVLPRIKEELQGQLEELTPLDASYFESIISEIKKENRSLYGKLEFIKKVLRELNPEVYRRVVDSL